MLYKEAVYIQKLPYGIVNKGNQGDLILSGKIQGTFFIISVVILNKQIKKNV